MYILPQLKTKEPIGSHPLLFPQETPLPLSTQTSRIHPDPPLALSPTSPTALAPLLHQKQVVFSLSPPLALDTLLVFSPSFPKSLVLFLLSFSFLGPLPPPTLHTGALLCPQTPFWWLSNLRTPLLSFRSVDIHNSLPHKQVTHSTCPDGTHLSHS